MGFAAKLENGFSPKSGNLNGVTAGSITGGNTISTDDISFGTLSALITVDAETNTITLTPVWEVSNDGSTWVRLKSFNNGTPTALATGTSGADTPVTAAIGAPKEATAWQYCRAGILVGVTTGTTNDTYSISYAFVRKDVE